MVWEDTSNLPFPQEVREIIKGIKWDEFEWHVFGLPVSQAKFTMSGGKKLYLSELPNGEVKVRALPEFTGNIAIGGYFVDENNPDGNNYFLQFIVTVCKGEVVDTVMSQMKKQPVCEYKAAIASFKDNVDRVIRISSSWWFRFLYRPWFLLVRGIGYVVLFFLKLFKDITVFVVKKLTPL